MSNWYKTALGLEEQIASSIATMLVNAFHGIVIDSADKIYSIVAAMPNEITLMTAIDKGQKMAARITQQTEITAPQSDIIEQIKAAFHSQHVNDNKIDPDNLTEMKPLDDSATMSEQEPMAEEIGIGGTIQG